MVFFNLKENLLKKLTFFYKICKKKKSVYVDKPSHLNKHLDQKTSYDVF